MAKTTRQAESIVSLKVTLRGIRPPVWRRLLVPGRITLGGLHHVIQAAMGWDQPDIVVPAPIVRWEFAVARTDP